MQKYSHRRYLVLAAALAVHAALLLAWARLPARRPAGPLVVRMHWTQALRPAVPLRKQAPGTPGARGGPRPPASATAGPRPAVPVRQALPVPAPVPDLAPDPVPVSIPNPSEPAGAGETRHDPGVLERRAIAEALALDRAQRKSFPDKATLGPGDEKQKKIDKLFAQAADAVPPKWYEAPRITPIADQGGYNRRIYKVVTAGGTYCVTYESNHAPDGIDIFSQGIKSKVRTCPREE